MAALIAAPAAEALTIALVRDRITVDIGYAGAAVTVFATSPLLALPDAVFKLVLVGPERPHRLTVRNRQGFERIDFVSAPTAWVVAGEASAPRLPPTLRQQNGLDMHMLMRPDPARARDRDLPDWRAAFARLKRERGLFSESGSIARVGGTMLRADFALPPGAPPGVYTIRALAFADGRLRAETASTLELRRIGLESWLFGLARDHAMLYGLLTVTIGLLVGTAGALIRS